MEESNALRELRKTNPHASIMHASQISATARVVVIGVKFGRERSGEIGYQVNEPCPDEVTGVRPTWVTETLYW